MSEPAPPPPLKPKRRRPRLLLIPALLLALSLVAFLILFTRGTWASAEPRNPADVSAGPVSQLFLTERGTKEIRCAVLLPYPRKRVWEVVTDYAHYSDFLPYLHDTTAESNGGAWVMKGQAASALSGNWPFEVKMHEDTDGLAWLAWWDETPAEGEIMVNRGRWELTAPKPDQTLLVLRLQAEVRSTPTFFLRNVLLHRLKLVVRAVETRLQSLPSP